MLLVHDDEADVGERGEERRARTHDDVGRAGTHHVPLVEPLAGGEARVQDGHVIAEAAAEAAHRLGRERNLGHEDDGPLALLAHALDGAEVDLGLARAGHAVDDDHVAAPGLGRAPDGGKGTLLPLGEVLGPGGVGARERGGLAAAADAAAMLHGHDAPLGKRAHHSSGSAHHGGELGHAHLALTQGLDDLALARGGCARLKATAGLGEAHPAVVHRVGSLDHELPLAAVLAPHAHGLAGRHHESQAQGQRRRVLAAHPCGKARAHLVEGRCGEHAHDLVYARGVNALPQLAGQLRDIADDVPVAKAHKDGAAHQAAVLERRRDGVVEAAVDGAGWYVGHDLRVSHAT